MFSLVFYTVTNNRYFPGTVAALSSIRRFHPAAAIWVLSETRHPLTGSQQRYLENLPHVHHVHPSRVPIGLVKEAWQLKAHAADFLSCQPVDCLIQVDSDAVLCSSAAEVAREAATQRTPAGGKDGKGVIYNHPKYEPYRSLCGASALPMTEDPVPYISTSILFLPLPALREVLALWSKAVDEALFGPISRRVRLYAGYGDQGVFNAILHFKGIHPLVLENDLVSQHWMHGKQKMEFRGDGIWNQGRRQIALHSVGQSPKFWMPEYAKYVARSGNLDEIYGYWLWLLFEGPCGFLQSIGEKQLASMRGDYFPGLGHDLLRQHRERSLGGKGFRCTETLSLAITNSIDN